MQIKRYYTRYSLGGRLDWTLEPNADGTYLYVMVYLLREGSGEVRCILDQHHCGLFSRAEWLRWMTETGFEARAMPFVHSEIPPGDCEIFIGRKLVHGGTQEIS